MTDFKDASVFNLKLDAKPRSDDIQPLPIAVTLPQGTSLSLQISV